MANDEQQLILRAQRGDIDAFTLLAASYRDRLMRFLWFRCSHWQDAEDATQEALISAWRYLPSYRPRWQFSTWLYRIGLRALSKRPQPPIESLEEPAVHDAADQEIDIDNVWHAARHALSDDALSALWLRYGEDRSLKDIAATMDKSTVWVKVSLMRSRQRLAKQLATEAL